VATPIEERLERLEARLEEVEATLARPSHPRWGLTVEEARARLGTPIQRSEHTVNQLRAFLGCLEGPEDLSENVRDYLYGERK
jgi:hypothetical protein